MSNKLLNKNIKFALSTHITTILNSMIVGLFLPKVLSVISFGYWQYFMFFASCLELLLLGAATGIYLKYGGKNYKNIDYDLVKTVFIISFLFEIIISVILYYLFYLKEVDYNKMYIWGFLLIGVFVINTGTFFSYLLQATNRIKENCISIFLLNIIIISLFIFMIIIQISMYYYYIAVFLFAHFIRTIVLIIYNIDVFKGKIKKIEIKRYINILKSGLYLLLADYSIILLFGIGRLFIEQSWGIEEFSKFSFSMSLVLLGVNFVNQIGLVLFPVLKKDYSSNFVNMYNKLNLNVNILLLLLPLGYFIIVWILSKWLPQYKISLFYLGILMPLAIFEAKMVLIINPFYKATRKERILLLINLTFCILGCISFFLLRIYSFNILYYLYDFLLLSFFRNFLGEFCLSKILNIRYDKVFWLLRIGMILFFLYLLNFNIIEGILIYIFVCIILIFSIRKIKYNF